MKKVMFSRIAMWASVGLLVSIGWGLYFASADKALPIEPIVYILASLTQPTVAVALYLKPAHNLGLTSVVVANAATYALFGWVVETIRRRYRPSYI